MIGSLQKVVTCFCCFLFAYVTSGVSGQSAWGESITIDLNATHAIEYIKYSTALSWHEAASKCGVADSSNSSRRHLLCFESRKQIQDLFPHLGNLRVWLGQRSCSGRQPEDCLSLNVSQSSINYNKPKWNFEFRCDRKLGFICRKFIKRTPEDLVQLSAAAVVPGEVEKATEPKVDVHRTSMPAKICPKTWRRNITWPETTGHLNVSKKCPEGMKGYAYWLCNGTSGEWGPGQPNLSQCRTVALTQVLQQVRDHVENKGPRVIFYSTNPMNPSHRPQLNLTETATNLQRMISTMDSGGDITIAVDILDGMEDVFLLKAPQMSPAQKRQVVKDTSRIVLDTCDQILTKSDAWNDLSQADRYQTATKFLRAVDETGGIIASTMQIAGREGIPAKNLELEVVKVQEGNTNEVIFSDARGSRFRPPSRNSLTLTLGPDVKHVVFAFYEDLAEILPTNQEIGERLMTLKSSVVSANISQGSLRDKVKVTLVHKVAPSEWNPDFETICVWWDTQRQSWNSDGCIKVESSPELTTCLCEHLTNFAVLVDVSCTSCGNLHEIHKVALEVITIIGCSISIFCLSVCIVLFSFYRSLWGMRIMIHRNLCICLLVAQILLLGGLDRTENKTVCGVIAGLLHYFFLAAFCWMFLEAFHIMWLLVKVFAPKQSHGIKFYIFGYGCPALVVAISAGCNPSGYGTFAYCWLSTEDGTIWSYLGPVLAIILFNTLTLGYALFTTHRIIKNKEKIHLEGFKMWVRGATVLTPLLGVTWIVGFLYLDSQTVIFAYIFAALNSLQGLGIFLFHCLLNKKVKEHVFRSWQRSTIRRSSGTTRSSTKLSKSSTPTKSSPKRSSKFFVTPDHSEPVSDPLPSPESERDELREESITFLQPHRNDGRDRFNTDDLYPLEVEK